MSDPTPRADAHIHFFEKGFEAGSFAARPGVRLDEAACYASLMREHHITAALIISYAAEPWCKDNNTFIALAAAQLPWAHPLAFIRPEIDLTPALLAQWQAQRFVGVTFYIFSDGDIANLRRVPDEAWQWIESHHWLISVNSRAHWPLWQPILAKFPRLRLLVSHLGLPPRMTTPPTLEAARASLTPVLELAKFPGVHVKLSGFYALSDPGHDYPHRAAWPYVDALRQNFGVERLLWASDFSPCLDWLSFPQTFDLFNHMPFFKTEEVAKITGGNLHGLLADVR